MKDILSIRSLIEQGLGSSLCFDICPEEVALILGSPDDVCGDANHFIEKRDSFQFLYTENKLISINRFFYDDETVSLGEGYSLTNKTPVINFIDFCNANFVPWKINQRLSFDRQLTIQTNPNVCLVFDLDFGELQRITIAKDL